eukprot:3598505-Prymnesium_polylepis.1
MLGCMRGPIWLGPREASPLTAPRPPGCSDAREPSALTDREPPAAEPSDGVPTGMPLGSRIARLARRASQSPPPWPTG